MIKVAVCDDNQQIISQMEGLVIQYLGEKNVELSAFSSGEELMSDIKNEIYFDILFLDIEMKQLNGIEAGIFIRENRRYMDSIIIYVSSYSSYALKTFDALPFYFLTKPIEIDKFNYVMDMAIERIERKDYIFEFKMKKSEYYRIPAHTIMYFSSMTHKIEVYTDQGSSNSYRGVFKDLEKNIESQNLINFVRIHRCYIVNLDYIIKFDQHYVTMKNNVQIQISGNFQKMALMRFHNYFKVRNL